MQQISVARLFDGQNWQHNVTLSIDSGRIHSIHPADGAVLEGTLVPGFIDVQVNGGGGALFNTDTSLQALRTMVKAHAGFGSTALLPTVITDSVAVMQQAADVIANAIASKMPGVLGVHFEGPHLSVERRGIHPAEQIRPLSDKEMQLICRKDIGKVMVTVAPETVPVEQIRQLVAQGVMVSLGHSAATAEQALAAIEAGARCFTHLFNAMSPLTSREPGMVGAALTSPQVYCGLILDHLHVHPLSARIAALCKGEDKLILVTDAMAHTGSELQVLPYLQTEIRRDGLKLTLPEGTLAGSALDMNTALRHFCQDLALPLSAGLKALSANPARLVGLDDMGQLQAGAVANMLLLDNNLNMQRCWLHGVEQQNNKKETL